MIKIRSHKLDNGLNVYFYKDKRKHSTFFQLITKFGGIVNDFNVNHKQYKISNGVAHILEHYISENSKNGDFIKKLGQLQMNSNATTSLYKTTYYFDAVEDISLGIDILLNSVYFPIFNDDNLEKIKGPILQEIRGRMDNKFYHSSIMKNKCLFHSLGFESIGGTLEEVKDVTIDDLKLCFKSFYRPDNQFIIVAGNFDEDEIINQLNTFYNNLNFNEDIVKINNFNDLDSVCKNYDVLYFPTHEEYTEIVYKINIGKLNSREKLDLDFYLSFVLSMKLGVTSTLYNKLVDNKIISGGINWDYDFINDYLIISIGAYSSNVEIIKNEIIKEIKKLTEFDSEVFELKKNNSILRIILRDEDIYSMVSSFISNLMTFNYPYQDTVNDIEKLNVDDCKKILSSLDFSNYTVINIFNEKDK